VSTHHVQTAFDEAKICKLFLQTSSAINGDTSFYRCPALDKQHADGERPKYIDALIERMLEISPYRRLSPREFVESVTKRCPPALCAPADTDTAMPSKRQNHRPRFSLGDINELALSRRFRALANFKS
jgi:hypothetical protein